MTRVDGTATLEAGDATQTASATAWIVVPNPEEITSLLCVAAGATQRLCRDEYGHWLLPGAELPMDVFRAALAKVLREAERSVAELRQTKST